MQAFFRSYPMSIILPALGLGSMLLASLHADCDDPHAHAHPHSHSSSSDLADQAHAHTNKLVDDLENPYYVEPQSAFTPHILDVIHPDPNKPHGRASRGHRIKNLVSIQGARDNQLTGYGIVTGLSGKGDSSTQQTKEAASNLLKNFGSSVTEAQIVTKNMATVTVTALLKPFTKKGSKIDVLVSSIGDSTSLQNGILQQTPLYGADGQVYAVASGTVSTGGFFESAGGGEGAGTVSVKKNQTTVGIIKNGAIVEEEVDMDLIQRDGDVRLLLRDPDFTTAVRIAQAVNQTFPGSAQALDSACVSVFIPDVFAGQEVNFLSLIEQIEAQPDIPARIVIGLRTGTIVATGAFISEVVVSYGPLTVSVSTNPNVSQPNALSEEGETKVTYTAQADVSEIKGGFTVIPNSVSVEDFARLMNNMGITTLEFVPLLEAIDRAGALHGELIYD